MFFFSRLANHVTIRRCTWKLMRWCFCCCVEYEHHWCFVCSLLYISVLHVSMWRSQCLCLCFLSVCPSVVLLLLNYSYFYLTKMKYESMMMLLLVFCLSDISAHKCHTLTFTCCIHCLCFLFLWFVTHRPSPPTSLQVLVCFGLTGHYADATL